MLRRTGLFILGLLAWCSVAHAQRELKNIPDPDPEIERQTLQVAEGFEVNLFVADPKIVKPIQMNFDSQGRLWIASSEVYPHIEPGQQPRDKVLIVEDLDGDGRADKTTVFADNLLIPTGLEPGDGGCYVANSTQLVHLADTNGDGQADQRRIVLSGFGTEDTHHILHTFRFGPDGRLYFNQSIYIHSHIETPYGVRRLGGGGIWQFNPESLQLDIFMRGLVNPWGHHFDRWGQSFATDGAGGEGVNFVVPGAYYFTAVGASKILHGLNPGSPKHCGLEVVSGRHFPDDWQGNIITNDFRANRVCRFVLSESGSGYTSREQPEVIKSSSIAFRPIDVKMGPDGALYVADWYNPIIQHGEVDFRDPRRDHTHGRIWRITAKDRALVERPRLVDAPVPELLEALRAPEDFTRHHAKLQLKARGREAVLPELARWVQALDPTDPQVEHLRLEALWTYQSLDEVEPNLLGMLLRARDHRARAAATRIAGDWRERLSLPLAQLGVQAVDEHPRVRLEAIRALSRFPSAQAFDLALRALDFNTDRFLDYAIWLTSREMAPKWLPALRSGELDLHGREEQLITALEAVDSPDIVAPLMTLVEGGQVPAKREDKVLALIGRFGDADQLAMIYRRAIDESTPREQRIKLIDALLQAHRERKVSPSGDLHSLSRLLATDHTALCVAGLKAAGAWKVSALRDSIIQHARQGENDRVRRAALDALVQLGDDESRRTIEGIARSHDSYTERQEATLALVGLDLTSAAGCAVELLAHLPSEVKPNPVIEAFVSREQGPQALAHALAGRQLGADVAKLSIRAAQTAGRDQGELIRALQQAGGIGAELNEISAEQLAALVEQVQNHGNAAAGELLFRRAEQQCLKCHAIGGAGGRVGPDLSSIGASAQIDYLIESILLPNKAVKENYHSVVVARDDGQIFSGILVRETERELVLRNADDQEISIPVDAIDEKAPGGSIMPAGLADNLTTTELVDLVRFLSELGKVGPYAVGQARVARRFVSLEKTEPAMEQLRRTNSSAVASEHEAWVWNPAYTTVAGELPLDDLPAIQIHQGVPPMSYVRCQIDVAQGGPVLLQFNDAAGLQCWLDGVNFDAAKQVQLEVQPGVRTLAIAIDRRARKTPLRVELADVEGSPSQAQMVTGK